MASASRGGVRYEIRPVTPDRWDELVAFFGPSGAYSNCWCTWWRVPSKEFSAGCASGGAGNRTVLERLTAEGAVHDGDVRGRRLRRSAPARRAPSGDAAGGSAPELLNR